MSLCVDISQVARVTALALATKMHTAKFGITTAAGISVQLLTSLNAFRPQRQSCKIVIFVHLCVGLCPAAPKMRGAESEYRIQI